MIEGSEIVSLGESEVQVAVHGPTDPPSLTARSALTVSPFVTLSLSSTLTDDMSLGHSLADSLVRETAGVHALRGGEVRVPWFGPLLRDTLRAVALPSPGKSYSIHVLLHPTKGLGEPRLFSLATAAVNAAAVDAGIPMRAMFVGVTAAVGPSGVTVDPDAEACDDATALLRVCFDSVGVHGDGILAYHCTGSVTTSQLLAAFDACRAAAKTELQRQRGILQGALGE